MPPTALLDLTPEGGWNMPDRTRIAPLPTRELSLPKRLLLTLMVRIGGAKCTNLYQTFFRNFRVYFAFARFNVKIMPKGRLSRRRTELAILRVAWKTRSFYEWGQHVDIGLRAGLGAQDIHRVTQGPAAAGWDSCEAAILSAVDEVLEARAVSPGTWQTLSGHLDDSLMIELMFLIATYAGLAATLNSVGVALEPELEQILARTTVQPGA